MGYGLWAGCRMQDHCCPKQDRPDQSVSEKKRVRG
jgi:hypothetical protein